MLDINGEVHRFNKSPEQLCKQPMTFTYDPDGLNLKIRIGLRPRIIGRGFIQYIESYSLWVNGTHFDKFPALPSTSEQNPYNQGRLLATVEANGIKILEGQMMWGHEAF